MDTWKKFAIVLTIVSILVVVLTLLAVNFNGWGKAVSGSTGPFTSGFFKLGTQPLIFGMSSGYAMLIFYIVSYLAIPLAVAYAVWHWDIGYKFSKATVSSPASGYDNNMKREPEEPERSQAPQVTK